jgi:hypothetical protein
MSSKLIKEYLVSIKEEKTFDDGFIDILDKCNDENTDGRVVANNIIETINQRHAENKKHKN